MNTTNNHHRGVDAARSQSALVYITPHLEFAVVEHVCLAVRDRGTGDFLDDHHALHEVVRPSGPINSVARLVIHTMGMRISSAPILKTRRLSSAERSYVRQQGWLLAG